MEIGIAKMTSKGQLVIPQEIRKEMKLREGTRFIAIEARGQILLRPATKFMAGLKEDLLELKLAEEGWKAYERGEYKSYSKKKFLKELAKW